MYELRPVYKVGAQFDFIHKAPEAEKIGFTFPGQILNSKIELSAMKKNELEDFKKTVSTPNDEAKMRQRQYCYS